MTARPPRRENRSRASLRRGKPTREPKPIVLIVCEGEKTEPIYLDDLRKALRLSPDVLQIRGRECGSHPKTLVKYAKDEITLLRRKFGPDCKAWCVFDRDEHKNIHEAFDQASANDIEVAFSNPCIELWYLLHFQDQGAHLERDKALRKLKRHVPDYSKPYRIYPVLESLQSNAIRRAEELRKQHKSAGSEETSNPSSTVDILIRFLESLTPAKSA